MDIKYLQRVVGYIALALAAVILIIDIAYQLAGALVSSVETMTVDTVAKEQLLTADGYIVRTEKTLTTSVEGILSPKLTDGTKVAAGDSVAEIYGNTPEQAEQFDRLQQLLHQQALMNEAYTRKNAYSQTSADKEIARLTGEINRMLADGKTDNLQALTDALQVMMYIREMKIGKDPDEAKKNLEQEIASLQEQVGGALATISADRSGYYYGSCDGYEGYLSVSDLSTADPVLLSDLLNKKIQPQNSDGTSGKIVTDYTWCVVIKLPFQQAQALAEGKKYTVIVSGLSGAGLTMKLDRAVHEYETDSKILIFSCNEQPAGFSYSRYQSVSVVTDTIEGYQIPVGALRQLNGITGVYVQRGSVIEFREVSPIVWGDGTVLADSKATPTGEYPMLNYYDRLVIRGKELYVGKIVHQ